MLLRVGRTQPPTRGYIVWIELERRPELGDRVGAPAGVQQAPSKVSVDDWRQRVEALRVLELVDRVVQASHRGEIHRVLAVRQRGARIERDSLFELALGGQPVPVEPEP